jgi:hypothetical protein
MSSTAVTAERVTSARASLKARTFHELSFLDRGFR